MSYPLVTRSCWSYGAAVQEVGRSRGLVGLGGGWYGGTGGFMMVLDFYGAAVGAGGIPPRLRGYLIWCLGQLQ